MSKKTTTYRIILVLQDGKNLELSPMWFNGEGRPTSSKKQAFKSLEKIKRMIERHEHRLSFLRKMADPYIMKTTIINERL